MKKIIKLMMMKNKTEKWIAKEKVGVVGHFLQNKAMVFNNDAN